MSSLQNTAGQSGSVARGSPGVVRDKGHVLLMSGDYYMHLADLRSNLDAGRRMTEQYARPEAWAHTATMNVAGSGEFSSDRSIHGYTTHIWHAHACPIR